MLFSIIHLNLSYKLCFLILCSLETWSCKLAYRSSVLLFLHFLLRRCMLFLSRSFCLLIRLLRHCVFCSLFLILFLVELLFHLVLWRSLILLVFCCWSNINWIRLLIVLVLQHKRTQTATDYKWKPKFIQTILLNHRKSFATLS